MIRLGAFFSLGLLMSRKGARAADDEDEVDDDRRERELKGKSLVQIGEGS